MLSRGGTSATGVGAGLASGVPPDVKGGGPTGAGKRHIRLIRYGKGSDAIIGGSRRWYRSEPVPRSAVVDDKGCERSTSSSSSSHKELSSSSTEALPLPFLRRTPLDATSSSLSVVIDEALCKGGSKRSPSGKNEDLGRFEEWLVIYDITSEITCNRYIPQSSNNILSSEAG